MTNYIEEYLRIQKNPQGKPSNSCRHSLTPIGRDHFGEF